MNTANDATKTEEFKKFMMDIKEVYDDYHRRMKFTFDKANFLYTTGPKFAKIIYNSIGQKSVYCFVEKASGDIYAAASWNSRAKHVRGNIFDDDNGRQCIGIHGLHYLTPGRKKSK